MKISEYISRLKYKPTLLNLFALFLLILGFYFIIFPAYAFGTEICLLIILLGLLLLWSDLYIQRKNKKYYVILFYGLIIIAAILAIWTWLTY